MAKHDKYHSFRKKIQPDIDFCTHLTHRMRLANEAMAKHASLLKKGALIPKKDSELCDQIMDFPSNEKVGEGLSKTDRLVQAFFDESTIRGVSVEELPFYNNLRKIQSILFN